MHLKNSTVKYLNIESEKKWWEKAYKAFFVNYLRWPKSDFIEKFPILKVKFWIIDKKIAWKFLVVEHWKGKSFWRFFLSGAKRNQKASKFQRKFKCNQLKCIFIIESFLCFLFGCIKNLFFNLCEFRCVLLYFFVCVKSYICWKLSIAEQLN